jgi:hypothetical protein
MAAAGRAVGEAAALLRPCFRRRAAHAHAANDLRGLIADVERTNGWQLAERAGSAHPRAIQRVLDRSAWDADAVRRCRRQVGRSPRRPRRRRDWLPQAGHALGWGSATVGKIANCQVGVFLGDAGPNGHAGIDRALSLPQAWLADPTAASRSRSSRVSRTGSSLSSPGRCWSGRWMLLYRPGGSSPTRSTAATERCGGRSRRAGKPTSWPCGGTSSRRPGHPMGLRGRSPSPTSRPPYHLRGGDGSAAARERKVRDATAGPQSNFGPSYATAGSTPSSSVTTQPDPWRSSTPWSTRPPTRYQRRRCGRLGRDGPSMRCSSSPRGSSGWITTRCGAGAAGTATSRSPCLPWRRLRLGSGKGGMDCPLHIPLTVPEIRRLLSRLVWTATHPLPCVGAWSRWRCRHQRAAQESHRRHRLTHEGEL